MTAKKKAKAGYRKPPVEHRFKPGQSGNPLGRPPGVKPFEFCDYGREEYLDGALMRFYVLGPDKETIAYFTSATHAVWFTDIANKMYRRPKVTKDEKVHLYHVAKAGKVFNVIGPNGVIYATCLSVDSAKAITNIENRKITKPNARKKPETRGDAVNGKLVPVRQGTRFNRMSGED